MKRVRKICTRCSNHVETARWDLGMVTCFDCGDKRHTFTVAPAYNKGKIDIQVWKGKPRDLEDNLAIVYVHKHASSRLLNKIADRMMSARPAEEWLYSHPRFKGHSTEVPVLIQQDLAHLSRARQKGEKI